MVSRLKLPVPVVFVEAQLALLLIAEVMYVTNSRLLLVSTGSA